MLAETGLLSKGFYNLAALGLSTVKRLQADLFGEMEMARCFDFWRKPINYRLYR